MRVTRFQYPLEQMLINKLDLIAKRLNDESTKRDAVLLFEGAEGEGKTTFSIACAYYLAEKTSRPFNEKHVFFDLEKMIKFAQETEKQIIIWDEPALQALNTDWASSVVKNLTRLLMMARKKRHCFMINMTKFYKFNEYIVVDRSLALLHVYSRRNVESGRFLYIKRKYLERLWTDYRFKKIRNYVKYASRVVRGTFPDVLNPNYKYNVLGEFDVNAYEKEKDKAIMSIGGIEKKEEEDKLEKLKVKIVLNDKLTWEQKKIALGVSDGTLHNWMKKFKEVNIVATDE